MTKHDGSQGRGRKVAVSHGDNQKDAAKAVDAVRKECPAAELELIETIRTRVPVLGRGGL